MGRRFGWKRPGDSGGGIVSGTSSSAESTLARMVVLDPTAEDTPATRDVQPRPSTLEDLTIGLLDISKPRGDVFLDQVERRLRERGLNVARYRKPTFTKPAPIDLRHEIAIKCDVVIEALAD
jgi:hypothetical protein